MKKLTETKTLIAKVTAILKAAGIEPGDYPEALAAQLKKYQEAQGDKK